MNGTPAFLLGLSYYGALGAPRDFVQRDLDDLQERGFNWLRVWATWGAYGTNVSAITTAGIAREPQFSQLKWLVAECDRRGMIVDVTLSRGSEMPDFSGHLAAVETLVTGLAPWRNWYLDLGNERDIRDARHVPVNELKRLGAEVKLLDAGRLVTASIGGHDLSREDISDVLVEVGVDFICPHRPRNPESPGQTEAATRRSLELMNGLNRVVPVHYQEPIRRGYTAWNPAAADFLADLRGALAGGAAGWCFHNGGQRTDEDEQPRRSFDLREKRLMDQLDREELEVVGKARAVVREFQSK